MTMRATSKTENLRALSAVTLATDDMASEVAFFLKLGFALATGGPEADFSTFHVGERSLNLIHQSDARSGFWGRVIFYVWDVDAYHHQLQADGIETEFPPNDAPWGERYFHLLSPSGHEISFATPLSEARKEKPQ